VVVVAVAFDRLVVYLVCERLLWRVNVGLLLRYWLLGCRVRAASARVGGVLYRVARYDRLMCVWCW
jgi:hypothetical protein